MENKENPKPSRTIEILRDRTKEKINGPEVNLAIGDTASVGGVDFTLLANWTKEYRLLLSQEGKRNKDVRLAIKANYAIVVKNLRFAGQNVMQGKIMLLELTFNSNSDPEVKKAQAK